MKYLLFRPGFLTEEYVKGRRASYLNPIRMYLFISAVFFLLYANRFVSHDDLIKEKTHTSSDTSKKQKSTVVSGIRKLTDSLDATMEGPEDHKLVILANGDTITGKERDHFTPANLASYDSFQRLLPKADRNTGWGDAFMRKTIQFQSSSKESRKEMQHRMLAHFFHSIPYMLFVMLPLLALLFKLLYIRRKQFYYVSHGIFIIHYFCFTFIALLLIMYANRFGVAGHVIAVILQLCVLVYLYIAMLKFYKQGWFKTLVKFMLAYFISLIILIVLFIGLIINAFYNVTG